MKKTISCLIVTILLVCLTGCFSTQSDVDADEEQSAIEYAPAVEQDESTVDTSAAGQEDASPAAEDTDDSQAGVWDNYVGELLIRQEITPDGEEFLFHFTCSPDEESSQIAVELTISNGNGVQQEIHFLAGGSMMTATPENFEKYILSGWHVIDFNFDGYCDILCQYGFYNHGESVYLGWLWNPLSEQFEAVSFEWEEDLFVDGRLQLVKSYYHNRYVFVSGDPFGSYLLQKYTSDGFVVTNRLDVIHISVPTEYLEANSRTFPGELNFEFELEDHLNGVLYKEYQLMDGEMVLVSEVFIEGDSVDRSEPPEEYCGEDSIWFCDGTVRSFFATQR